MLRNRIKIIKLSSEFGYMKVIDNLANANLGCCILKGNLEVRNREQ